MPFQGFEGPAGTGKTYQLIEAAKAHCAARPLADHQRILALTFMHGSRRRLDERLSAPGAFRGLATCMTIDSFALDIVRRWRSLAHVLSVHPQDFNQTCDVAGQLLEYEVVAQWVAATYPVVLVDEAQELSPPRLRVIRALAPQVALFVAADEFQCLDETLDTMPFMDWFRTGQITSLTQVRRTSLQGLLNAALALRSGQSVPARGAGFQMSYERPNQMPFAVGHALHAAQRRGGTTAVIIAPGMANLAQRLIPRLRQGMQTPRQTVRPLSIERETRTDLDIERIMAVFDCASEITASAAITRLNELSEAPPWLPQISAALAYQQRACGTQVWSTPELRSLVERKANMFRAYGHHGFSGIPVITIHGAKNRQFRNVVVLWGPAVQGDSQHKARLLYNAITRAEAHCRVFSQTQAILDGPPFTMPTT